MNIGYYFGINNATIGPLDEQAVRDHAADGTITETTLAWCKPMDDWKPVAEIAELMEAIGETLAKQASPPPLRTASSCSASDPPPLPHTDEAKPGRASGRDSSADDPDSSCQVPHGLGGLGVAAYQIVFWLFRPWRGRPSLVRRFVQEDPKRAIPVAAATLGGLFLLLCLALAPIVETLEDGNPQALQQQPSVTAGRGRNAFQPLIDAQRENDQIMHDSYRHNRDSFNQQLRTYRAGTYDWYNDND